MLMKLTADLLGSQRRITDFSGAFWTFGSSIVTVTTSATAALGLAVWERALRGLVILVDDNGIVVSDERK